jgi:hypothetical protein
MGGMKDILHLSGTDGSEFRSRTACDLDCASFQLRQHILTTAPAGPLWREKPCLSIPIFKKSSLK